MSNKNTGHQLKENGNPGRISKENRDRIKNSRTEGHRNTSEVKNHLKGVTKSKPLNGKMTNAVPKVNHKCRTTTNANTNPLLLFPSGERLKELDMAYEGAMDLLRILDEDGINRGKGRSKHKSNAKRDMQNEVDMAYEGAMQLIANGSNSHIAFRVGNHGPSNGGAEVGGGTRHTSAVPTKPTPQSKGNLVAPNAANASPLMPTHGQGHKIELT